MVPSVIASVVLCLALTSSRHHGPAVAYSASRLPMTSAATHQMLEDVDLLATFASSAGGRLIVAHATRAWRGPGVRAHICFNGEEGAEGQDTHLLFRLGDE